MPQQTRLERAIEGAIETLTGEIADLLRSAELQDIVDLGASTDADGERDTADPLASAAGVVAEVLAARSSEMVAAASARLSPAYDADRTSAPPAGGDAGTEASTSIPAPARRGRPAKARAKTAPKTAPKTTSKTTSKTTPKTGVKQRRVWPLCSVDGCSARMYAPSGPRRLCYRHHLDAGGELAPFARGIRRKEEPAVAEPTDRPPAKRTILRKRRDEADAEGTPRGKKSERGGARAKSADRKAKRGSAAAGEKREKPLFSVDDPFEGGKPKSAADDARRKAEALFTLPDRKDD